MYTYMGCFSFFFSLLVVKLSSNYKYVILCVPRARLAYIVQINKTKHIIVLSK